MATAVPQCYSDMIYLPTTLNHPLTKTHIAVNPPSGMSKFFLCPIKTITPSFKLLCKKQEAAFSSFGALFAHPCIVSDNPDPSYSSLLELCASHKALSQGQQVHTHLVKSSLVPTSVFLSTKLLFMYGKCGFIHDAEKVFDRMSERNIFSWNAMMGAYVSNGQPLEAIATYMEARFLGVPLDSFTFPCVLKACGAVGSIRVGAEVHGLVIKLGFCSSLFVANSLVSMYAKCDDINGARKLFDRMDKRNDVVSWNSIISTYSANGKCIEALGLFREMQKASVASNTYTFVAALQACVDCSFWKQGMEIHCAILKSGQFTDVYVANALLAMYSRFGQMDEASQIFDRVGEKDKVTWNSLLVGFIQNGLYDKAFHFFYGMQDAGVKVDEVSVTSVAAACGRLGYLLNAKEIHAYSIKNGFDSTLQVGNTLIDLYSKCGWVRYIGHIFDRMPEKDSISWTTVIAGYAQNNCHEEALELSRQVLLGGMKVDVMMIGSVLLACSGLKCLARVKEVHAYTMRHGLSDLMLHNTLVDLYGQCGNIDYANQMFASIKVKDVVSWTSMISTNVHNGLANEALECYINMQKDQVEPDSITLLSLLSAAATLSSLKKGKEIHGLIIRKGFMREASIPNSLADMYACCGSVENAYKIFCSTRHKNLILWTTMINAYGMHGRGRTAVELFNRMKDQKLIPDHITFLALLYACSHSGLTDEGKQFLKIMKNEYQLEPWPEHYTCLVDLLGRANRLEEAYQFIKCMPIKPNAEVWCALLGACRIHSNKTLGEIAAKKLLELEPDSPGNYVLVSNVFASSGRWNDIEEVRMRMKRNGLKKTPGCSWIEVGNKVHTFVSGDKSHIETDKIYEKLAEIKEILEKKAGYVPQTKYVLHNAEEEKKIQMLYGHSERLAIAYGLLATLENTPMRITKNLRVCGDCHNFCKLVSKFFGRELVVRDASRFHHFKDGVCSCGDFW